MCEAGTRGRGVLLSIAVVLMGIGCCQTCGGHREPSTPPPDRIWFRVFDLQPLESETPCKTADGDFVGGSGFWIGTPSADPGVGAYVLMPVHPPSGPPVWKLGRRYVATSEVTETPGARWVLFDWDGEAIDSKALWREHTDRPVPDEW